MTRFLPGLFALTLGCTTPAAAPLTPDDAPAERSDATEVVAGPVEVVPSAPLNAEAHITSDQPDLAEGPTPPASASIAELLRARHAEDLPDAETLNAHGDAPEALVWLSLHGDSAMVRVRATRALGQYPDAARADHLASLFLADDTHPALRAAALDALSAYDAPTRQRFAGILKPLADHADPRVARAAAKAGEGL